MDHVRRATARILTEYEWPEEEEEGDVMTREQECVDRGTSRQEEETEENEEKEMTPRYNPRHHHQ